MAMADYVPASITTVQEFQGGPISTYQRREWANSGAIVHIATRSGRITGMGTGFEFLRNEALDARNFSIRCPAPVGAPQSTFKPQ